MAIKTTDQSQVQKSDIKTAEYRRLEQEIASIDQSISSIATPARLDEATFKEIFLPMFLGVEKELLHPHAQLGGWITCAGGVYNEVEIIDNDGTVLFKVPPAKLQLPVDYKRDKRRTSLLAEIHTANLHMARHPKLGEKYLKQVLDSYVSTKELEAVIGYLRRWNEIFKRYGHPEFKIPGDNPTPGVNQKANQPQDDTIEILL